MWELFFPPEKRKFGWYVLPILFRDRFVGRIEPRIEREDGRVQVIGFWWEDGFAPRRADGFVDAMREALRAYLRFAGARPARVGAAPHRREAAVFVVDIRRRTSHVRPHVAVIGLGVRDFDRAKTFYSEGLGWPIQQQEGEWACFILGDGSTALTLFGWDEKAADARVSPEGTGFRGITLSYNVRSEERVDEVLDEAERAGGTITKPSGSHVLGRLQRLLQRPRWQPLGSADGCHPAAVLRVKKNRVRRAGTAPQ